MIPSSLKTTLFMANTSCVRLVVKFWVFVGVSRAAGIFPALGGTSTTDHNGEGTGGPRNEVSSTFVFKYLCNLYLATAVVMSIDLLLGFIISLLTEQDLAGMSEVCIAVC